MLGGSMSFIIISFYGCYIGCQLLPKNIYVQDFQTGFSELCPQQQCSPLSDSIKGRRNKTYTINFITSFQTVPQVQAYFTSYHDNIAHSRLKIVINASLTALISFSVTIHIWNSNVLQGLTIQWIASTNNKIQILSTNLYSNTYQTATVQNFGQQYSRIPQLQLFIQCIDSDGEINIQHIETLTYTTFTVTPLNTGLWTLNVVLLIVDQSEGANNNLNLEYKNFVAPVDYNLPLYDTQITFNTLPKTVPQQILFGFQQLGKFGSQISFVITLQNLSLTFRMAITDTTLQTQFSISYGCLTQATCDVNAQLDSGGCTCNNGYYVDTQQQKCNICDYSCLTCYGPSSNQCLKCDTLQKRILNINSCQCQPLYFDQGISLCWQCDPYCETCTGSAYNQCLSCITSISLINENQTCNCLDGYFKSQEISCQACSYTCATCNQSSNQSCTTCSIKSQRTITGSSCPCNPRYFDDGINGSCKPCSQYCQKCIDHNQCQICLGYGFRYLHNNSSCVCQNGYYDDGKNELCLCKFTQLMKECDQTCLTCVGSGNSNCTTCGPCNDRVLHQSTCICIRGSQEVNGRCEAFNNSNSQIQTPLCNTFDCNQDQQNSCSKCPSGFYFNNQQLNLDMDGSQFFLKSQYCQPCNSRCLECIGPQITQCTRCKFISIENQCKLCTEVSGLYNVGEKCVSSCGDGIIYKPYEECDDGNQDQYDGCSSQCLIVPMLGYATLKFIENQSLYNNTRTAVIQFQYKYTQNDFNQWHFVVTNNDPQQYNLSYLFVQNQLQITICFNSSVYSQNLIVTSTQYSPLVEQNIKALIPDYTFVSQDVVQATQNVLTITSILYNYIFLIMLIAIMTGGFEMFFELLDLLQLLSYLKYFNVDYPYNVNAFFDYLSAFNFSFITNSIPFINNYTITQFMSNDQQLATQPSDKIYEDGYISLFSFNFLGIFCGWICALLAYLASKLFLYIFSRWNNLDDLHLFTSMKKSLYILRFSISRFIVLIFTEFAGNFMFSGLLQTLIASEYALNFSLMLQLNQLHLISVDALLTSSSWLAVLILSMKIKMILYLVSQIQVHKRAQLKQIRVQRQIGSAMDGLNLYVEGAKYFGILNLLKIFVFMFSLVILYDNRLYQVAGVMLSSSIASLLVFIYSPNEDKNDFWKAITCEVSLFVATSLIFLYAVNQETNFLFDDQKILIGWFIISSCLVMILVQILINIKIHCKFTYLKLKHFCRYVQNKLNQPKKMKIKVFKAYPMALENIDL